MTRTLEYNTCRRNIEKTKKITRGNYVDGSEESSGDWNSHCTSEADLQLKKPLKQAEQNIKIDKLIFSSKIDVEF